MNYGNLNSSYTLLESPITVPKLAFSNCHIDTSSEGHPIFHVYMGQIHHSYSISSLYGYNITLGTWFSVVEAFYN